VHQGVPGQNRPAGDGMSLRTMGKGDSKMLIIRATKPLVVDYLESHLEGDYHLSKESLADGIRTMLQDSPDDTLVLTAFEGEEIKAFMVGCTDSTSDHVALIQAWSDAPIKTWKSMFLRFCIWTEAKGKSFIRAETSRGMEKFLEEFKFQEIARVMSFTVTEENHEEIVDEMIARQSGKVPDDIPNLGSSEAEVTEPSRIEKIAEKIEKGKEKKDANP